MLENLFDLLFRNQGTLQMWLNFLRKMSPRGAPVHLRLQEDGRGRNQEKQSKDRCIESEKDLIQKLKRVLSSYVCER